MRSLRLINFRCFPALDLTIPAQGVLLTGDNAQGKTSVLEAVCMLVRLHSPRTHRMPTLARRDSSSFGIAGDPWGTERQIRWSKEGLQLKSHGEIHASRHSYLADGGLVVWMGNEDLELIRGPGERRRRFLDFIGTQISLEYRRAWSRYSRALKAKGLLLKEGRPRDAEIRSYEEILVEHGTLLMETRDRIIREITPLVSAAHARISGRQEEVSLTYLPASGPNLRESMLQARERESRVRQCVVGPHRDDFALRIHGMPASEFASEGQQRTLALALKLAQGNLLETIARRTPIYLLDDIFGELDPTRRNALMRSLPDHAQKWITTTHLGWLEDSSSLGDLGRYRIQGGQIHLL